jgi:hypothetical protein
MYTDILTPVLYVVQENGKKIEKIRRENKEAAEQRTGRLADVMSKVSKKATGDGNGR